jgi:hypothetical protein
MPFSAAILAALTSVVCLESTAQQSPGERLPASAISPLVRESMAVVLERQRSLPPDAGVRGVWNGQDGRWYVPPIDARVPARSGEKAIVNEWGDSRIGFAFPAGTGVGSLWVAGHGGAAARAVQFRGFRGGVETHASRRIALSGEMQRCDLDFDGVDRVEAWIEPAVGPQGWIALDDLELRDAAGARVVDFEDLPWRHVLSGTSYAGIQWEHGKGFRTGVTPAVHAPLRPPIAGDEGETGAAAPAAAGAALPTLWQDVDTARQGDAGANLIPPDTCGAAGPDHFVSIVNANLSVYRKSDGSRLLSTSLPAFWPGSSGTVGDPRIVFDPHAQRFVAMATNFSSTRTIYLAISANSDPTGAWFKFSYQTNQGTDASKWPDYPTLGVDARGLYLAAYMVGGTAGMTIWAIDKAPLLATPPSVGTITAWRSLPWEGAIQPCTTYGDPGAEYLVSRQSSTGLRLRRVMPPLTAPTLVEHGTVAVPSHSSPPLAPALGSTTAINTIDYRPMNAVFRNGSVWTTHGINVSGRAGCRWYEIAVSPLNAVQIGTIGDPLWHYYYPSIAVDAAGDACLGFSGSHAAVYCSAFYTGRVAGDAPGTTAPPALYKAGEGPWNRLDGSGRNRFGDYSHVTVDPVEERGFWAIQEYIRPGNLWGTRTARVGFEAFNYGDGLAGTANLPFLRAAARPVLGQNLMLEIGNSIGSGPVTAAFVAGTTRASLPLFGGTLLVTPALALQISVPVPHASLAIPVPNDPSLAHVPVLFQVVEVDAGAAGGFSFTPGLEVRCASR